MKNIVKTFLELFKVFVSPKEYFDNLSKDSPTVKTHPFFEKYKDQAIQNMAQTKIPASVTLAQAALESNWGKSAPGFNFFGIKGHGPAGTQVLKTWEYVNGQKVRARAHFRVYNNALESFYDHSKVISQGRFLKHAMEHTGSAQEFIDALQGGRFKYATDPKYAKKIMRIIKRYNLEAYDECGSMFQKQTPVS